MKKKDILSLVKSIFVALLIVILCRQFFFVPVTVKGESMKPTFEDQNRVIISKMSKIEAFNLIVFQSPISSDKHIKRVIGLPGDQIEIIEDTLYINGYPYPEPYLDENKEDRLFNEPLTGNLEFEVPDNSFFVLGDNRLKSMDSRIYGVIKNEDIIGEVKLRIYPFQSFGMPK